MLSTEISYSDVEKRLKNLLGLLTEKERTAFEATYAIREYSKNEIIYHQGEAPDHLLCLLSGKVKIYREGVDGRCQIMRLLCPGQYFGYRASLAQEPYVTAAAAFEPAWVCSFPMSVVKHAMSENIALCNFFVRELAVDLGIADSRIVGLTQKHLRGRLAETLLFLKNSYGTEADGRTLRLCLSRENLAGFSNMTTSNAIRTLSSFSTEKLIELKGRRITLLDEQKLIRISRMG